jgi:sulfide:quinone oxidoreductase
MSDAQPLDSARIVIAGGGVAGFETALALRDLAGDRAEIHLVDAEPELTLRALAIEEPFSGKPAERHALAPALAKLEAGFTLGRVESVDVEAHTIGLEGEDEALPFDRLVVCLGARAEPAFGPPVVTLDADRTRIPIDSLIERASSADQEIALLAPPSTFWPLPLYEFALLARERSEELDVPGVGITVYSPEAAPLEAFGQVASTAVADLLDTRRVRFVSGNGPENPAVGVALPSLRGPALAGLPDNGDGFIPTDEAGGVVGTEGIYAAGDGTTFPIKQGGIASQQADQVAATIATELGADVPDQSFEPVLRGMLLTGGASLYMVRHLADPGDHGIISESCPWWPPEKVAGRYLAAWLRDVPVSHLDD